jgi:sarcosine/dimethylglycine N-methyltransferase
VADLAPLDQVHGRGLEATRELAAHLGPKQSHHLLDIGCGIGGPARFIAAEYGCRVTGIDLTMEFCEVARMLNWATGLADKVVVEQASALALPFDDATFDAAYTQNVSMNVADKRTFYAEAARVVKPDGWFVAAEYAVGPGGPPVFPVPWARVPEDSHLATADDTRRLLEAAGFEVLAMIDRTPAMLAHYEESRRRLAADGPPKLGIHVLLGVSGVERLKNSARSVEERRTVPIEAVCRRL